VIRTMTGLLVMLVVTPPLALLVILAPLCGATDRFYDGVGRLWCRIGLWATRINVRVEGATNIPPGVPVVMVCNHQSWFDVPALAITVPRRYRFIAKRELRSVPLWGRAWEAAGHVAIDRRDTDAAIRSLDHIGHLIRSDNSAAIIFPEGTRSPDDEMLPFKKGAFKLAQGLGVATVPVAVVGSRKVLPKNGWRVSGCEIIVRFGEPIPTWEYGDDRTDELMNRARTAIAMMRDGRTPWMSEEYGTNRQHTRA
jgi:1-acyl-sn-glycerol-3-phosphate acyltransferase